MERKALERRTVLKGGAAAFGMIGSAASAATIAAATPAAAKPRNRRCPNSSSPPSNVFARPFPPISIPTMSSTRSYRFS